MGRRRFTMEEVVGQNVRAVRERLGWSQARLRDELVRFGIEWSRPTVAQLELGKRPISVSELVKVGFCLGVAPHVLLYPPAGSAVDCGEFPLAAPRLARWLWEPEESPLTSAPNTYEQDAYLGAMELYDVPADQLEERSGVGDRPSYERWREAVRVARRLAFERPDLDPVPSPADPTGSGGSVIIRRSDLTGSVSEEGPPELVSDDAWSEPVGDGE